MSNEFLWLLMLAVNFISILLFYRLMGKTGLFIWIPISVILANIQVLKTVELFGITNTLGNIVYATSFLVTDILSENYSKKDAFKAVMIGFMSLIFMTVIMQIAIMFQPSADDFAQESLQTIFGIMPRIALASLTAFLLSEFHDIWAYNFWKKKFTGSKNIWIRNNASTAVSQLIDSTVFTTIAFLGVFPREIFIEILITTCVLKWIVAALDTPCVYIAEYWHRTGKIK
jgi:queuosine precursor transporter